VKRANLFEASGICKRRGGSMKSAQIFDVCHGRYRGLREWLKDSTGTVRALDLENPSPGYHWRPDRGRACEYVADFERIGRRVLHRADWKGRMKLFNIYFVRGADYRRAVRLVGVAEETFEYWRKEVRRALGAEFSRTALFPPWRYFQPRTAHSPSSRSNHFRPARRDRRTRAPRPSLPIPTREPYS
jgi:hypothetical protein